VYAVDSSSRQFPTRKKMITYIGSVTTVISRRFIVSFHAGIGFYHENLRYTSHEFG